MFTDLCIGERFGGRGRTNEGEPKREMRNQWKVRYGHRDASGHRPHRPRRFDRVGWNREICLELFGGSGSVQLGWRRVEQWLDQFSLDQWNWIDALRTHNRVEEHDTHEKVTEGPGELIIVECVFEPAVGPQTWWPARSTVCAEVIREWRSGKHSFIAGREVKPNSSIWTGEP